MVIRTIHILPVLLYLFLQTCLFAKECPKGQYLVSAHPRQAYYRNDGTFVSATTVKSYCKNYRDKKPLIVKFKNKMPAGWPHKKEKFRKCTTKEKKKILMVLKSLPKSLTQIGKLQVFCAHKSETNHNPATSAPEEKIIVFYDSAMRTKTKRIIAHELAHVLYESLSRKELKSYWQASGWSDDDSQKIPTTQRTSFSAPDGKVSPSEDFANNVESFLAEPKKLKKDFNIIYSWIKKCIGDTK